jgi:hypothetical protein
MKRVPPLHPNTHRPIKVRYDIGTRSQAPKPSLTNNHKQLLKSLNLNPNNGTWEDLKKVSFDIKNGKLKLIFKDDGSLDYCEISYKTTTPRIYRSQIIQLKKDDFCLSGEGSIEFSSSQHQNTSIVLSGIFNNNLEPNKIYLKRDGHNYYCPKDIYPTKLLELIDHQVDHKVNLLCKNNRRITIDLNKMTISSDSSYPRFQIGPDGTLVNYSNKFIQSEKKHTVHFEYQIKDEEFHKEYYWISYNNLSKTIDTGKGIERLGLIECFKDFNPNAPSRDELGEDFKQGYREMIKSIIEGHSIKNVTNINLEGTQLRFNGYDAITKNPNARFVYYFTTGETVVFQL